MFKLNYLLFISFFLIANSNFSQSPFCGTEQNRQQLKNQFPTWDAQFEQWLAPKVEQVKQEMKNNRGSRAVVTIPVIVHIIHNAGEAPGTGYNIDYSYIVSQIDEANLNMRALMADTINIPPAFKPLEADCEVEFCLALVDTNNAILPEIGVNRVDINTIPGQSDAIHSAGYGLNDFDSDVKPYTIWDPNRYFNVWVCELGGGVLGYAQFPENSTLPGLALPGLATGPTSDGVVMDWEFMGAPSISTNTDLNNGRIFAHEVGHWLGLRHIWGDVNAPTCGDDFCADTPPQDDNNSGSCPSYPHRPNNQCGSGTDGEMFGNYMGYVNAACMNIFSLDQKARMIAVLNNADRRGILATSNVCQSPFPDNAAVTDIIVPKDSSCSNNIRAEIKLTNQGTNTLTSCDIYYSIDAGVPVVFNWTGALASGASTNVNLPLLVTTNGNHTYNIYIDSTNLNGALADGYPVNNSMSKSFYSINGHGVIFDLTTDCKADDISWELTDTFNNVIISGGGYDPGIRNIVSDACLDTGCYILRIMDVGGNGMKALGACTADGFYSLKDVNTGLNIAVSSSNPNWGDTVEHEFCMGYNPMLTPDYTGCDTIYPGGSVTFTDQTISNPAIMTWFWDFGDGNTSTQQNPTHQYSTVGNYNVKLVVSNPAYTDSILKSNCVVVIPTPPGYCDTLKNFVDTDTMVTYTILGSWGYYPGHNGAFLEGFAEPYNLSGPTNSIQKVVMPVVHAHSGSPTSSFVLNVYDDNTGSPGAVLSSDTILISSLTAGASNEISLSYSPIVTGDFWVGFEIDYSSGDTLAVATANHRPGATQSTTFVKAGTTWQLLNNLTSLNTSMGIKVVYTDIPAIANITVSDHQICAGQTVSFNAGASSNYDTLKWFFPGGSPATSTNSSQTVTYATSGTYEAILYLENICAMDSIKETIIVDAGVPVASFTESSSTICAQDTIHFDGTATTGTNLDLSWDFQGGTPNTSLQLKDTIVYQTGGTYNAKLLAENGCGADSVIKPITVNAFPTTTVTPFDTTICEGNTATLNANGGTSYIWSDASITSSITVTPATTTTYWVTSSNGVCNGDTAYSTVNVNPIPTIVANASPDTICLGSLVSFFINGSNAIYYSWDFGDGNTSSIPNTTHNYTAPGSYTATLTGTYGVCDNTGTVNVLVKNCTDIEEGELDNFVKVYPNPAKDFLVLDIDLDQTSDLSYQLISSTGSIVINEKLSKVKKRTINLDLNQLASGIYTMSISNTQSNTIKRIVIAK